MLIEHGTLILVLDGAHMTIYRNAAHDFKCELELVEERHHRAAKTAEMGTRAPRRSFASNAGDRRRNTYESTDYHQHQEDQFAAESITVLEAKQHEHNKAVIIITPPKMLGVVRKLYGLQLQKALVAEIHHDYVQKSSREIAHELLSFQP